MAKTDIVVKQSLDNSQFKRGLQNSKSQVNAFGSALKSLGPMIAGAFSVSAIAGFIRSAGQAYDTQLKAEAKVAQAVKQTGGAAGYSAEQLNKMAAQLQKVTRYGDEQILNDVTAQLLSFPQITGEVFKNAQKAVLDVATLLDGDVKSSAIAVGKALADPLRGITAMRRMGIMFSDTQMEHIKALVEQNKLYEAQELILKEINVQYGGQAEAAAETGLGALAKMQNAWGDFKEKWFDANFAEKGGWLKPFADGLDYMTWRMEEFKKRGGGFAEWWKRFLKLGAYSEDAYNRAMYAEANAEQLSQNAATLTQVNKGFQTYGEMVDASAEANNKLTPTIEKTEEQLAEEAKAAKDASEAYQKLLKDKREYDQESMAAISGGISPITTDELSGGGVLSPQQQSILEAMGAVGGSRITGMQLPTEELDNFNISLRNTFDGMSAFTANYATWAEQTVELNEMMADSFKGLAMGMADAMSTAVTTWIEGGDGLTALFQGMLGAVANFLKGLGQAMMASGMAGIALKALSSNPALAIAAGLALQVAAGAVEGIMSKGVKMADGGIVPSGYPGDTYPALLTSGEAVIPPHKLGSMGGPVVLETVIRGEDLYILQTKAASKHKRYT